MATKRERTTRLTAAAELPVESQATAKAANLSYVSDSARGISRHQRGTTYVYSGPDGQRVRDETILTRIRSLAIPPAWSSVWICTDARGHMQATGRDAKGRKQYRYHARWHAARDETKYGRVIAFGEALPLIHRRTGEHIHLPNLPREKVLATIVQLLEATLIRVGNAEYARSNKSFGLTTMRDHNVHVEHDSSRLRFEFRGKQGKTHVVELTDRRLARVVKRCRDIPGQELFQYVDDTGQRHSVGSADVNDYLRELTGQEFTAKDFRTWAGTVLAARALAAIGVAETDSEARRRVVEAVEQVAKRLGNTPAICRKCYIHPAVVNAYLCGSAVDVLQTRATDELKRDGELDPAERAVLRLLRHDLRQQARGAV